jgi:hypothetical protein
MRNNALLATMLLLFGTPRAWSAPVPDLQGFDEYVKGAVADWQIPALAGQALLKKETLEELFRPQTLVDRDEFYPTQRLTNPHWTTYGLGWFQQDYRGRAVDFHTGSIDGMVAIHGLVRAETARGLRARDLDHAELRHALMYRVFDLYDAHGDATRDWSAEVKTLYDSLAKEAEERRSEAEKKRAPGTKPSLSLEANAGTYSDELAASPGIASGRARPWSLFDWTSTARSGGSRSTSSSFGASSR